MIEAAAVFFAGFSIAFVAGAHVWIWWKGRRVKDEQSAAPAMSIEDRIVASAWRIRPDQWAALPEGSRMSLRRNVSSAPGPLRG